MADDFWMLRPVGWLSGIAPSISSIPGLETAITWGRRSPLELLFDGLASTVVGRRRSVTAGGVPVSFTLASIDARFDVLGSAMAQVDDIEIEAIDVDYDGLRASSVSVEPRNLHIRTGDAPTLVSAPVDFTVVTDWDQVNELVRRYAGRLKIAPLGGDRVRLQHARGPRWSSIEVEVAVEGGRIMLYPHSEAPVGRSILGKLRSLGGVPLPTGLGPSVRIVGLTITEDAVTARLRLDEARVGYSVLWSMVQRSGASDC